MDGPRFDDLARHLHVIRNRRDLYEMWIGPNSLRAHPRIESIAQPIPQQVEAEDGQGDCHPAKIAAQGANRRKP